MLCESCKERNATTHIKRVVNGVLAEAHLCTECAREYGYQTALNVFDMGSILGGLFSITPSDEDVLRCKNCGSSFEDIRRTGKIGCAQCYNTFRDRLKSMIQQIHGVAEHKGKKPGSSALRVQDPNHSMIPPKVTQLERLKADLKKAVEEQNFENAAQLRDQIKELEKADGR